MATYPYAVRLDRRACVTGVYDPDGGWTTFELPYIDYTVNRIVLSDDFGGQAGTVYQIDWIEGNVAYVYDADLSGGTVAVGRLYPMVVELTRPFVLDRQERPDVDAWVTQRQLTARYEDTGDLTLLCSMRGRQSPFVRSVQSRTLRNGDLKAWFRGNTEDQRLFIQSLDPRPTKVVWLEHVVDYEPRMSGG